MELDEIIVGCKNGNEKCQNCLVQTYASKLMALCMRYTKDRDLAKDALQETFINAFKYIHTFQGTGSFEGWLRRIAVNCSLKVVKTIHHVHLADESQIDHNSYAEIPDIYGHLNIEEILKLLSKLPHSQYLVFNLSVVEGYNHSEIATILKITESTSRATLCKARNKLVELISAEKKYGNDLLYVSFV